MTRSCYETFVHLLFSMLALLMGAMPRWNARTVWRSLPWGMCFTMPWLCHLLSVCALAQAGFNITFSHRSCTVSKDNSVLIIGKLSNNVYSIENVQVGVQMESNK